MTLVSSRTAAIMASVSRRHCGVERHRQGVAPAMAAAMRYITNDGSAKTTGGSGTGGGQGHRGQQGGAARRHPDELGSTS